MTRPQALSSEEDAADAADRTDDLPEMASIPTNPPSNKLTGLKQTGWTIDSPPSSSLSFSSIIKTPGEVKGGPLTRHLIPPSLRSSYIQVPSGVRRPGTGRSVGVAARVTCRVRQLGCRCLPSSWPSCPCLAPRPELEESRGASGAPAPRPLAFSLVFPSSAADGPIRHPPRRFT